MRDRLKTHFNVNTCLAMMPDKRLKSILSRSINSDGWGQTSVVEINAQKVFVKSIPLTDREMENAYSTKNLFGIPTWYNYGVGSAGFGAFRELAAHVKTTNWVRDGQFAFFPLLHHYRIVATAQGESDLSDLKSYVQYWNGSKTVERYIAERSKCKHHLLLFLEYLTPFTDWVDEHPSKTSSMFRNALKSIDFLHRNGIIHFDAHEHNWLTDGTNMFLCDFGLVLDREFELNKSELQFFKSHRYYDYAQLIAIFGDVLMSQYFNANTHQWDWVNKELTQTHSANEITANMQIRKALDLHDTKMIKFPNSVVKHFQQYQAIIYTHNDFIRSMFKNKKTSNRFPSRKLATLLKQVKIIE